MNLGREDIIIPDHPETIVAVGAALSLEELFADRAAELHPADAVHILETAHIVVVDDAAGGASSQSAYAGKPFFETAKELEDFRARHALPACRNCP